MFIKILELIKYKLNFFLAFSPLVLFVFGFIFFFIYANKRLIMKSSINRLFFSLSSAVGPSFFFSSLIRCWWGFLVVAGWKSFRKWKKNVSDENWSWSRTFTRKTSPRLINYSKWTASMEFLIFCDSWWRWQRMN